MYLSNIKDKNNYISKIFYFNKIKILFLLFWISIVFLQWILFNYQQEPIATLLLIFGGII